MKTTFSVIKADIGSLAGHGRVYPDVTKRCEEIVAKAKEEGLLMDYHVTSVGDDTQLIMTHKKGVDNEEIHKLAWDAFIEGTKVSRELKLYGAGQDLLTDTFSGNVKGMGPGVAEMEFEERPSDPVVVFCCDKTEPGAFNLPLFRMFADPFCTAGLVIDPSLHEGYEFEMYDVMEHKVIKLKCPEEMYDLLAFLGATSRYVIKRVWRRSDNEIAASCSTERLSLLAGKYVGKDDPVAVVRAQSGFPAVGEVLEPFSFPHLVGGWMRGSHNGPLMPCAQKDAHPTRFDGPPRAIALGFQLANGKLLGPADLFDDPAFDRTRDFANEITDYMRRHGPFEPQRLPADEMEYTTLPGVMEKLKDRFEDIE
ncbi:MAG: fructose-1,6-bisphosphate aldolase/phosphatase [Methanobacterium sp.]|jgi:fructose 1,6-bisphosphate aldolase/phosphatase